MSRVFYCILPTILCGVIAEYYFVRQPTDTHAIMGMSLHLQCEVIATEARSLKYTIHWIQNSSAFTEKTHALFGIEENIHFNGHNFSLVSNLSISQVSRQDGGLYRCDLHRTSGQFLLSSHNARVSVIQKPRFLQEPKNTSAIEGGVATLECRIGSLDSKVMLLKWTKEDLVVVTSEDNATSFEDIEHNNRYLIVDDKSEIGLYYLQILEVRRIDAGYFHCIVYLHTSGEVILKSLRATLVVLYPPDENYPSCKMSESKRYSSGDTLTTECISRGGNGPLRLSWIRNGDEINGTRINEQLLAIRDTWTLTSADNGANITCVMEGKAVLNKRHCVIGPLSVYFGPIVYIEPKTTQVFVGQPMTFKCSVKANPPITTYLWFLNGEQLDNSNAELKVNWFDIENRITSAKSEINITCAADSANSRISDATVVKVEKQSNPTEPTASPEIQMRLSTLTVYIVICVLCFLLTVLVLLVLFYLCRIKKVGNDSMPISHTHIDASHELRTFHTSEIALGLAGQNFLGKYDINECSLNSTDDEERTRLNGRVVTTTNEYENIHRRQVGHTYQSLTSRSNDTYMKLNPLTRMKDH